jgi:hypothetical protein
MNSAIGNLVQKLRAERGSRHPFEGHPLEKSNDFVRNKYLQTLAALALYKSQAGEDRKLFFDRLVAGTKAEFDTERYFGMAPDISEETLEELAKSLAGEPALRNAFACDALLLCRIDGVSAGQAEFLAELLDVSGISEEGFAFLLKLAEAILKLDTNCLSEALCLLPAGAGWDVVYPAYERYLKLFLTSLEEAARLAEGFDGVRAIMKLSLHDGLINKENTFAKGRTIAFINCHFSCPKPLSFGSFDEVVFRNCVFRDFKTKTVILESTDKASFIGCEFKNCCENYHDTNERELGCVIYSLKGFETQVVLDCCQFKRCGGKSTINLISDYKRSAIICNATISVSDSKFDLCWHEAYGGNRGDANRCNLFSHVAFELNNELNDSAKLH